MDSNPAPINPTQNSKILNNGVAGWIILFVVLICISGLLGFLFGKEKGKILGSIPQKAENNLSKTSPSPKVVESRDEGRFAQEFTQNHTYGFDYYLIDKNSDVFLSRGKLVDLFVFNGKDSGWPLSLLEQTFNIGVMVTTDEGDIDIGYSEIDPSVCYQTSCEGVLQTITKTEQATVSGILSKKVEATAYTGGGIKPMEGPPRISLYIIPYLNKFFIISGPQGKQLEKISSSFSVTKN